MDVGLQAKLLRFLQERVIERVGGRQEIPIDVRVVGATHQDLKQRIADGLFREDLYYRLAGLTLTMPPLRERVADIPPIARQLVQEVSTELGHPGAALSDDTLACFMAYAWPGNIRELRNEIARALALSDALHQGSDGTPRVMPNALSARVLQGAGAGGGKPTGPSLPGWNPALGQGTLAERLDVVEALVLRETLLRHRWNKTRAAKELGLSRVGLRSKMQRLGLEGT